MSDFVLAECIYIKKSMGSFGSGATSRESIMESLWFPIRAANGFVELFPVMDDLKRLLKIKQRVPSEQFKEEYAVKDNSRDIYLNLRNMLTK
ncbi:MAG: hypothetical protein HZC49_09880 [Nitrospirae bacterium]|nr:hypothetical protein [Nitrospirota bacterium]